MPRLGSLKYLASKLTCVPTNTEALEPDILPASVGVVRYPTLLFSANTVGEPYLITSVGAVQNMTNATANQTALTGSDENSATLSYTPGKVLVFLNGVLMDNRSGKDYAETNTSTITFNSGLQVNDTVIIKAYSGTAPFTRYQYDVTSSNISNLSGSDANGNTLSIIPKYTEVFVNGVLVKKGQWSSGSGTKITFSEALKLIKDLTNALIVKYSK